LSDIPPGEEESASSAEFLPKYLNLLGIKEISSLRPALEILRDRRAAVLARWYQLYVQHFVSTRALDQAIFDDLFGYDLDALVQNLLDLDLEGFETDLRNLGSRLIDNGVTFAEVVASMHFLEEAAWDQFHGSLPQPLDTNIYQQFDKLSHCRMILLSRAYFEGQQAEVGARIQGLEAEVKRLAGDARQVTHFHGLVGTSPSMRGLFQSLKGASTGKGSVLIYGESGTGKELVARALHELSGAAGRPFVAVNCAAFPRELIESELFGHGKGAYTGAQTGHLGLIRSASGGTLFLDEVTEMPTETQAKLLRVIEERAVRPVGALREINVEVRFVAATNRDPEKAVAAGLLREDLYHRLSAFRLMVRPLRERPEDVPPIVEYFLDLFSRRGMRRVEAIDPPAMETLQHYRWPGNVRELRNAVEQALTVAEGPRITRDDLPAHILLASQVSPTIPSAVQALIPTMEDAETALIRRALEATQGNKLQAAKILKISRHRLYDRLRKLGLEEN
jgi:transcriptional regulator with PAS, ATPase and Fis domain